VGSAEEKPLVGRVDGRCVDANDDFFRFRLGRGDADERNLEDAVLLHCRAKLKSRAHGGLRHVASPVSCLSERSRACLAGTVRPFASPGAPPLIEWSGSHMRPIGVRLTTAFVLFCALLAGMSSAEAAPARPASIEIKGPKGTLGQLPLQVM